MMVRVDINALKAGIRKCKEIAKEMRRLQKETEMILFFDTETTGVPKNYKAPYTDSANWPRLVQLGFIVYDLLDGGEIQEVASGERIVKPEGFVIPPEVSKIHGITQEQAEKEGLGLADVLSEFREWVEACDQVVGHNLNYDVNIVNSEHYRLVGSGGLIVGKSQYDTMLKGTNVCKLPGSYGKYKWPKLFELYQHLFQTPLAQTHTALDDIHNTAKCYFELRRLGVS